MNVASLYRYLVMVVGLSAMDCQTSPDPGPNTGASYLLPSLSQEHYAQLADINIGFLLHLSVPRRSRREKCTFATDSPRARFSQFAARAIEIANQEFPLRSKLKFGFAILDVCGSDAILKSMAFLPQNVCTSDPLGTFDGAGSDICLGGLRGLPHHESFQVVGVVSTLSEADAAMSINVLNAAQIPVIGAYSYNRKLSNKSRYPYFTRFAKDALNKLELELEFIRFCNWTYVSLVIEPIDNFRNSFHAFKKWMDEEKSFCLATWQELELNSSDTDASKVFENLLQQKKQGASVVIFLASGPVIEKVFSAVMDYEQAQNISDAGFVWLTISEWIFSVSEVKASIFGKFIEKTLFLFPEGHLHPNSELNNWFARRAPSMTDDPFFYNLWLNTVCNEYCLLNSKRCQLCKPDHTILYTFLESPNPALYTDLFMDAVYVMAGAVAKVLQESPECAKASSAAAATDCVTGPTLFRVMRSETIRFQGRNLTAWEKDVESYAVYRARINNSSSVDVLELEVAAVYDTRSRRFAVNASEASRLLSTPSRCGEPCGPQEIRQARKPIRCCWTCLKCLEYQWVSADRSCEKCEKLYWPDKAAGYSTCTLIPPKGHSFTYPDSTLQIMMALFFMFLVLLALFLFVHYQNVRVIKATSFELSVLMLSGSFLGFVNMLVSLAPTSPAVCAAYGILYDLSFALRMCPLLIRLLLVYTIFNYSVNKAVWNPLVSRWSRVVASLLLTCVSITMTLLGLPKPKQVQPDPTVPYVELFCEETGPTIFVTVKLWYNNVVLLMCLFLSLQTRNLPDNFNESGYIFMIIIGEVTSNLVIYIITQSMNSNLEKQKLFSFTAAFEQLNFLIFLFFTKIFSVLVGSQPLPSSAAKSAKNQEHISNCSDASRKTEVSGKRAEKPSDLSSTDERIILEQESTKMTWTDDSESMVIAGSSDQKNQGMASSSTLDGRLPAEEQVFTTVSDFDIDNQDQAAPYIALTVPNQEVSELERLSDAPPTHGKKSPPTHGRKSRASMFKLSVVRIFTSLQNLRKDSTEHK